jgi:hypothetical protein
MEHGAEVNIRFVEKGMSIAMNSVSGSLSVEQPRQQKSHLFLLQLVNPHLCLTCNFNVVENPALRVMVPGVAVR